MKDAQTLIREIDTLQKASARSLPFVAIGLIAVLISLGYSAYKLAQLRSELDRSSVELATRQEKLVALQQSEDSLNKEIKLHTAERDLVKGQRDDLRDEISSLQSKLLTAKQDFEAAGKTVEAQKIDTAIQQSQSVTARVDLKGVLIEFEVFADPQFVKAAEPIAHELASRGYTFLRINQIKRVPDMVEVRYYHSPEDKILADQICDLLRSRFGITNIRPSLVNDNEPPKHFIQISFSKDALSNKL